MRVSDQMMEKDENAADGQLVIASESGSGETRSSVVRDHTMIRLAVPSEDESGLSARRSGHLANVPVPLSSRSTMASSQTFTAWPTLPTPEAARDLSSSWLRTA